MLDLGSLLLLSLVAFLAAMLSGTIGFGGGIILLPVLSGLLGVAEAVPILTAVQIVSNFSRVMFSFREISWRLVRDFTLIAIPCTLVGGLMFVHLNQHYAMKAIGAILLIYVAAMAWGNRKKDDGGSTAAQSTEIAAAPVARWFRPTAGLVGFLSGLVGTAGPIGAAAFLSCNLGPGAYIASDAISSLLIHCSKLALYHTSLNLPERVWTTAALLSVATMAGSLCGKMVTEKLSKKTFRSVALGALTVAGVSLLV